MKYLAEDDVCREVVHVALGRVVVVVVVMMRMVVSGTRRRRRRRRARTHHHHHHTPWVACSPMTASNVNFFTSLRSEDPTSSVDGSLTCTQTSDLASRSLWWW